MKRCAITLLAALLLGVALVALADPAFAQIIIRRAAASCSTCTTDLEGAGGYANDGTNIDDGGNSVQECVVYKMTLAQSGCGDTTPTDWTIRFRNADASNQRARFVVYTDDGNGGTAGNGEPDTLVYEGGCFYHNATCSSPCENVSSQRIDSACTNDGTGETDGQYSFPCASAPDDVWWVGWCAEQLSVFHFVGKASGAGTDDINRWAEGAGYFDDPPATWPTGSDTANGYIARIKVVW